MKTALQKMPPGSGRLYALSPDFQPELKKGHVLTDQSLPVEERIEKAKADLAAKLKPLIERGRQGDLQSQIEVTKETPLLKWLCSDWAKGWVEEHYPHWNDVFTKYQFKILEDGFVRFTLPKGVSYLELFEEANRYCREKGRKRAAVDQSQLDDWWRKQRGARACPEEDSMHEIIGMLPGSVGLWRDSHRRLIEEMALVPAALEAVVAAAALYYCQTGRDLLEGSWALNTTVGSSVLFSRAGLFIQGDAMVQFSECPIGCAAERTSHRTGGER